MIDLFFIFMFCIRYSVLDRSRKKNIGESGKDDPKVFCERILKTLPNLGIEHYQIGKTKIFLREQVELTLEKQRFGLLNEFVKTIQKTARIYLARKKRRKILIGIINIQKSTLFFFFFFFFFF